MAINLTDRRLFPNYLSIDYETYRKRIVEVLKKTTSFADMNFSGSNISLLVELLAYQNELNTYYLNKLAAEQFSDTAVLYENIHRIASMQGYNAKGWKAARATLTITIPQYVRQYGESVFSFGDTLYVPYGTKFIAEAFNTNTQQNENFIFIAEHSVQVTVPNYNGDTQEYDNIEFSFNVPVIQGEPINLEYTGNSLVDYKIILPFQQFDHSGSISLSINDEYWTCVDNFYSDMSNISEMSSKNVYRFLFNKYKQYVIEFSPTFSLPKETDSIKINLIKTLGEAGNVGMGLIKTYTGHDILNISRNSTFIPPQYIIISNNDPAAGGEGPQSQQDILLGGKATINGQERCVTKKDYKYYLEARSDVDAANVWGEQEVNKSGDVREYNKVHISVVPNLFSPETVQGEYINWNTGVKQGQIYKPSSYFDGYIQNLKTYLEPRKFITTYEVFDVPDLIYFAFHFSLRLSQYYSLLDVGKQLLDKLRYYFLTTNRKFNENISFMELHNWLLDTSIAGDADWNLLSGIQNLVFRNIWLSSPQIPQWKIDFYQLPESGGEYKNGQNEIENATFGYNVKIPEGSNVFPPNMEMDFPQYTSSDYLYNVDNRLKVIQLGNNQFPRLAQDLCIIDEVK